ncbi:MAG TPA: glycosyltransferase family 4 protein [Casimicrobiaceae bacterium]|nr:glycosyltransferase family 4 protein [Casimicrobiaceae bacterium]
MKVVVLSGLYPNTAQPTRGLFIEHRVKHLGAASDVELRVVAPVPWFPFKNPRFGRYAVQARAPRSDTRGAIPVLYPRYPAIPKIGMNSAPALLAAALLAPLHRLLTQFHFEVIDAYYLYPDGVAAALLGQRLHKPVVMTALGSDVNIVPRYRGPRRMIRWATRHAVRVTTVSQALKTRLLELGVPDDRIVPILHGVDQDLFRPPEDRASLRARLGVTRRSLLSVDNLIELKGHHLAIAALADLPDTELYIAGQGADEAALRKLAVRLGVADRVRMLGALDQAQLAAWYGAADALVLASSNEGIPNVVMEAMACGTPVIATAVGGIPEVVSTAEAGVLMPERSSAALVRAVQQFQGRPRNRAATRRHAERFSWQKTAEDHMRVLEGAVGDGARAARGGP